MSEEEVHLFEDEPEDLIPGIQIFSLRKIVKCRTILKCFTLNAYQGQITVVVGPHEGGKTILMRILRGSAYPTNGTANIDGNDIRCDRCCARRCLGVAPQCNALWCDLTVCEHLYFWSRLKACMCKCKGEEEARYWICRFGLQSGTYIRARKLTYGMKRKLAIANAFCGGSKIILLDDPTSGLDPATKQDVYKTIKCEISKRTVLVTTHLYNEAEFADRVALMYKGEVIASGSMQFIRDAFGGTYTLIIHYSKKCCPEDITKFVKKHLPCIEIKPTPSAELRYYIDQEQSYVFSALICDIETNGAKLGIKSFNLVLTPIEDVVLRYDLKKHYKKKHQDECLERCKRNNTEEEKCPENEVICYRKLRGCFLCWNQFNALFCKRLLYYMRCWVCLLLQILFPILLLLILTIVLPKYKDKNDNSTFTDITDDTITTTGPKIRRLRLFKDIPDAGESAMALAAAFNTIFKRSINKNLSLTFFVNPLPYVYQLDTYDFGQRNFENDGVTTIKPDDKKAKELDYFVLDDLKTIYAIAMATCIFIMVLWFIKFYIRERASCFKIMQFISGVNIYLFWFTAYLIDIIIYLIIVMLMIIIPLAFGRVGFTHFGYMFLLALIFGLVVLPLIYLFSLSICNPCCGYYSILLFAVFPLGLMFFTLVAVLIAIKQKTAAIAFHYIFSLSPFYALMSGLAGQANTSVINNSSSLTNSTVDPFHYAYPGILANVLIPLFLVTPLLFYWLIAYDMNCLRGLCIRIILRCRRVCLPEMLPCEDSDVFEERRKILKIAQPHFQKHDKVIIFRNLTKCCNGLVKINKLNLGIRKRECFGIVGIRGAGKSTLMRILVGAIKVTCGNAWICTFDVKCSLMCARKFIGYLPQCDYGFLCMTVIETLSMHALLRGIPKCACGRVLKKLAQDFYFEKHMKYKMKDLSYSTRKRVFAAIALIGDPPVLLLDEPTGGVDSVTRYYIWKNICKVRSGGTTILLTTDSLEEAEALCTRVTILSDGECKCLGAPQYLRKKFVKEVYKMSILKCKDRSIDEWVLEKFPDSLLVHETEEMASYELPNTMCFNKIYDILENAKCKGRFCDYILVQPGFDEVYMAITKEEEECRDEEPECKMICP